MKTALLIGATGLIGKQLLGLLQSGEHYKRVIVITRRPIESTGVCENVVLDFEKLGEACRDISIDDVFCCLGTTMRVAGSKEAFRKVDYEYPLEAARMAKNRGATRYFLVSALGADKNSSVFYNRVKGEVESAIVAVGFDAFHIFRPSLLLGKRTEVRSGERAAIIFFKAIGFLMPLKYKAIDSLCVAKCMLYEAKNMSMGTHIHESAEMQKFSETN